MCRSRHLRGRQFLGVEGGYAPLAQFYQSAPVRHTLDLSTADARTVIVNAPRLGRYIKDRYPRANVTFLNAPFDFSLIETLQTAWQAVSWEVRVVGFAGSITLGRRLPWKFFPRYRCACGDRYLQRDAHGCSSGIAPPELVGLGARDLCAARRQLFRLLHQDEGFASTRYRPCAYGLARPRICIRPITSTANMAH